MAEGQRLGSLLDFPRDSPLQTPLAVPNRAYTAIAISKKPPPGEEESVAEELTGSLLHRESIAFGGDCEWKSQWHNQ